MVLYNDSYPIVHNDNSEPINLGLLIFCEVNTTVPKNVKDTDGVNLGSKIVLNEYGRTERQIVCEGDYSVQVYSYIGPEFDIEDLSNFNLLRVDDIFDPTTHIEYTIGGETTVNTIDELKAFNNPKNGTIVQVNGYYESGDCPLRLYVYDEFSSSLDDNGGTIKPDGITGLGRWKLVVPDVVDVRYFGVFPSSEYREQEYYTSRLQSANNYSRRYSRTLYFPSVIDNSKSRYGVDGITIRGNVRLDRNVVLYAKGATTNKIINDYYEFVADKNAPICEGSGTVVFEGVDPYTKWMNNTTEFTKYDKVIYNGSYPYSSFKNDKVEFVVDMDDFCNFENCVLDFKNGTTLSSDSAYTFTNMLITDAWFKSAEIDVLNLTLNNCVVDISNFVKPVNYFNFAIRNGDSYFDFKGKSLYLRNTEDYSFSKDISIVNAYLSINLKNSGKTTFKDSICELFVDSEFADIEFVRTNMHSNTSRLKCNNFTATDSVIDAPIYVKDSSNVITCDRSNVNKMNGYNINLWNCNVYGAITSKPHTIGDDLVIDGYFNNNTFMLAGYQEITYTNASDENIKIQVNWIDNTYLDKCLVVNSQLKNGIQTYAYNESDHNYIWKGNKGSNKVPKEFQYGVKQFVGKYEKKSLNDGEVAYWAIDFNTYGGMHWGYEVGKLASSNQTSFSSFGLWVDAFRVGSKDPTGFSYGYLDNSIAWNRYQGNNEDTSHQFLRFCPIWDLTRPNKAYMELEYNGLGEKVGENSSDEYFYEINVYKNDMRGL